MKAMEMGEDMLKELGDFETRSGLLLLSLKEKKISAIQNIFSMMQ